MESARLLTELFAAGLTAADPLLAVHRHLHRDGDLLEIAGDHFDLAQIGRLMVIAVGKAAGAMAQAAEQVLGRRIDGGLVVIRTGSPVPALRLPVRTAGHPLPDGQGLLAAERLERLLGGLAAEDLVLVLLSGGASALLPAPLPPLGLTDKIAITQALLASGADISAVNTVRRRLSRLKGGGLLRATTARIATLALSDCIGDDPRDIGSGPTAPLADPPAAAETIVQRLGLLRHLPNPVSERLRLALARPLLPPGPARGPYAIIASNRQALDAIASAARTRGQSVFRLTESLCGQAREQGEAFAHRLLGLPSNTCLLAGGETTVTLGPAPGRGGRNQEAALAAALILDGRPDVSVLCGGTDGSDGPTEAAGGIVDGRTARRITASGRDPLADLVGHDAYPSLEVGDALLKTGPTGTNVMDVWIGTVTAPPSSAG